MGEKELKKWREEDLEMQKNEDRVEEQIRMLKKERNIVRLGPQRRAPNPKRQKLDEDAEISPRKPLVKKQWLIPEPEKRKIGEQEREERCTSEPKRIKRNDIRFFIKSGEMQSTENGRAELPCRDDVLLDGLGQAEHASSAEMKSRTDDRAENALDRDMGDVANDAEMQRETVDQAEQTIREDMENMGTTGRA